MAKERTTEARGLNISNLAPSYEVKKSAWPFSIRDGRRARYYSKYIRRLGNRYPQGATFHHASTIRIFRCIC